MALGHVLSERHNYKGTIAPFNGVLISWEKD